jgi:hypothetical protein
LTALADETAKVRKITVTFSSEVTVNGTVVKPGSYRLYFDEQAGELTIRKDGDIVAKTKARLEKRESKAKRTSVTTQAEGETNQLVSVSVDGEDENIVLAGK